MQLDISNSVNLKYLIFFSAPISATVASTPGLTVRATKYPGGQNLSASTSSSTATSM